MTLIPTKAMTCQEGIQMRSSRRRCICNEVVLEDLAEGTVVHAETVGPRGALVSLNLGVEEPHTTWALVQDLDAKGIEQAEV